MILTHPDYDPYTALNDLALVQFTEPVTFNDRVRPICLATLQEETTHYSDCWAVGWGALIVGGGEFMSSSNNNLIISS